MQLDTVLFDLDGTLTDSAEGIINTLLYALDKFDCHPKREELYRFIGPPLTECFEEYIGPENAAEGVEIYRRRYAVTGLYENKVYDGIPEMLASVKKAGFMVALSTSKPEEYAKMILEHFGLLPYFDIVAGARMDGTLQAKADVIELALSRIINVDRKKTVIVGDRLHDMEGAEACGIGRIGVLWGFGSVEELLRYHPLLLAKTPAEVADFLTAQTKEETK
ncbi:5'-nucleotidase [bioreactor metagenome]|uniref:5'-nucleotidase n=1 Tax=bioreactor metagenome TaxID=1076179 RepID=A0A644ZXP1_9ZZZZ